MSRLGPWLMAVLLVGCVPPMRLRTHTKGSREFRTVEEVPVRGAPVTVALQQGDDLEGELLAVDAEHVWLQAGQALVAAHRLEVKTVKVSLEGPGAGTGAVMATLGTLSAASHGFAAVVTGPLWLAIGIPAVAVAGSEAHSQHEGPQQLHYLYQYARYPQGLPAERWACTTHPVLPGEGLARPPEATRP